MIDLGPNAIFIISSYVGALFVLSALITWVWINSNKQQTRLLDLEKRGARRRSQK